MKYAVNHPWKFERYGAAFLCGFLQSTNVIIVELVNFIALLTNTSIIDVIMNFLALVVIAEFDEYFYSAISRSELVDIVKGDEPYGDFLIHQRTTSIDARFYETQAGQTINELEPQDAEKEFEENRQKRAKEKL